MSVYDLYQSYLNAQKQTAAPTQNILDPSYLLYLQQQRGGQGDDRFTNVVDPSQANAGITSIPDAYSKLSGYLNPYGMVGGILGGIPGAFAGRAIGNLISNIQNPNTTMFGQPTREYQEKLERTAQKINQNKQYFSGPSSYSGGKGDLSGGRSSSSGEAGYGGFCFDPNTPVQMADGSEKKIKDIQLGDETKGGEVTGVFQFKAADEIHNYKGVTVAGSHYVKENGKFIMVKDSPIAVKIDKIPVVYSLDTSGRRIFIKDIEFADYNGDGIAKNFLNNAGIDLSGFDKEVLRQVENRIL